MPVRTIEATSEEARMNGDRMRCTKVFEIRVSCSAR
jgi:hypothetical protein